MSRSAEDWQRTHNAAVKIRATVREALDLLDLWEYSDVAEETLVILEMQLQIAEQTASSLIGESYVDWAYDDQL